MLFGITGFMLGGIRFILIGIDVYKRQGLLHDCAKCIPNDQKIEMCEKNHILINPVEYKSCLLYTSGSDRVI